MLRSQGWFSGSPVICAVEGGDRHSDYRMQEPCHAETPWLDSKIS